MNLVSPFSWFAGWRWQRSRAGARPDFADMGTAFGLDASMTAEPPSTMSAVFTKPVFTKEAFTKEKRPGEGALGGSQYQGADRRRSPVDLREGQPIDRRSRL
ncbi:MAG: hypothetical protein AD742_01815 [Methylibium sp. NZG]|nr:MAG: hypothetical protein AD742_01815 [Methylibium sp. NZG]